MKIFNGKKAAQKILAELAAQIKKEKIHPVLAVILIGEDEVSKIYVKSKKNAGKKIDIEVKEYIFGSQAKEQEIIDKILELNNDGRISGIIVQLPLPAVFSTEKIIDSILPSKDVDGFHKENRRLLEKGEAAILPVLPSAILVAIRAALKNDFVDKKILALVNSETFGQTLKLFFKKDGIDIDYRVRNTCIVTGVEKELKAADVAIMVCGCPNFIKADMIKEGAVLIDGGITRWSNGKIVGDFDAQSVKDKAAFLTPVPGGIGPLTVALLLKNVYLASKKSSHEYTNLK